MSQLYRKRVLMVLGYVGSLVEAPIGVAEMERHRIAHLFDLLGSPWPRRGHLELAAGWAWPDFGSAEDSLVVDAQCRSERTRATWSRVVAVLRGTLDARPLIHLAGRDGLGCRWRYLRSQPWRQEARGVLHRGRSRALPRICGDAEAGGHMSARWCAS